MDSLLLIGIRLAVTNLILKRLYFQLTLLQNTMLTKELIINMLFIVIHHMVLLFVVDTLFMLQVMLFQIIVVILVGMQHIQQHLNMQMERALSMMENKTSKQLR